MTDQETTEGATEATMRQAVAEESELANLAVRLLLELREADNEGDDATVSRYQLTLDDVIDRLVRADRVRRETDLPATDDATCGVCGAPLQPVYETPRLLGHTCRSCDWTTHDPSAQAATKLARARDAAFDALVRALEPVDSSLDDLSSRRRATREQAARVVRESFVELAASRDRLRELRDGAPGAGGGA